MRTTISELAARLKLSYSLTFYLVQILHKAGIAKRAGYKKQAAGRPCDIWELECTQVTLNLDTGEVTCH